MNLTAPVTQADIDAAEEWLGYNQAIALNEVEQFEVQETAEAFARHRIASQAELVEAADAWEWLAKHPGVEISHSWDEDEEWVVHMVHGGRNDREWTLIGEGSTPLAAVRAALAKVTPTSGEGG